MSTEADDRYAIGDWAIRSLREAIEAGKPITVAELEVLQAAAEARGYRKAIERLRDDLLAASVQRKFADEWHQDVCACDSWPDACPSCPGLYGGTPLDRAPDMWTVPVVLDGLADYLEAMEDNR